MTIETVTIGIKKIEKTNSTNNIDTYTITFTDNNQYMFVIKNSINGVNGKDGEDGITPKLRINQQTNE